MFFLLNNGGFTNGNGVISLVCNAARFVRAEPRKDFTKLADKLEPGVIFADKQAMCFFLWAKKGGV